MESPRTKESLPIRQEISNIDRGIGGTSSGRPTDIDRSLSSKEAAPRRERDPGREPLPPGVDYVTTGSPPNYILVRMPRGTEVHPITVVEAINNIIAVLDRYVVTQRIRRAIELISNNRDVRRQIMELITRTSPESTLEIPIQIHRRESDNYAFAVTILSTMIVFPAEPASPPARERGRARPIPAPPVEIGGGGRLQAIGTGISEALLFVLERIIGIAEISSVIGSIISSVQMAGYLVGFRTEYLRYAYRRGYWHAIFWTPPCPRRPEDGAYMSGDARRDSMGVVQRYNEGYTNGLRERQGFYRNIWHTIYQSRSQCEPHIREFIEQLNQPNNQRRREEEIAHIIRDRIYRWNTPEFVRLFHHPVF